MWKKFEFFTSELLQSDKPSSNLFAIQAIDITCVSGGNGLLLFADSEGGVTMSTQNYSLSRFQAHKGCINSCVFLKSSNILLTIASSEDIRKEEDINYSQNVCKSIRTSLYANPTYSWITKDLGLEPVVIPVESSAPTEMKLWSVRAKEGESPTCLWTFELPETVTCACVNEENDILLLGCLSGAIYSIKGNLARSKRINPTRLPTTMNSPITGLHFALSEDKQTLYAYVLTDHSTGCFIFACTGQRDVTYQELDSASGCQPNCSCITDCGECIVARDGGLFRFRNAEGVGCYAISEPKLSIGSFKDCLLVCTKHNDNQLVTAYNTQAHFIEYQCMLKRDSKTVWVQHLVSEWNDVFVITQDHSVFCLHKLDLQSKLSVLYEQKLFSVALSLAHRNDLHYNTIVEIHKMYGDHLYEQGEYDDAVEEYVKTIGVIEPSYVVRRFLDAHRLPNLTEYLEMLHKRGLANKEHTTLLLKCYARMHLDRKLREFVRNDNGGMKFDVITAIHVLRDCGCMEEAKELALRSHSHHDYIDILMEEKQSSVVLKYIHSLAFSEATLMVSEFGRILLDIAGEETTDLLIDICTGYIPIEELKEEDRSMSTSPISPVALTPRSSLRDNVLQTINSRNIQQDAQHVATAAPAFLASLGERVLDPMCANPSSFIPLFASHPALLLKFLRSVVKREKKCDVSTWNMLLEMVLREEVKGKGNEEKEGNEDKEDKDNNGNTNKTPSEVMSLLRNPKACYDEEQALILVQTYSHTEGEIYLYKKNGMYSLLLQHYLNNNDSQAAITVCKDFGGSQNSLWIQLITIIAHQPVINESFLHEILDYIEKSQVLPLLYVLQFLCQNDSIQLSMIRKYVINLLKRQKGMTQTDHEKIEEIEASNQGLRKENAEIVNGARLFQTTKCSTCGLPLELPVVHFVCGHSYHKACLGIDGDGCSRCAYKFKSYLKLPPPPTEEQFFQALRLRPDGFDVTAEFFGKCMFSSLEAEEQQKEKRKESEDAIPMKMFTMNNK